MAFNLRNLINDLGNTFKQGAQNLQSWGTMAKSPQMTQDFKQNVVQPAIKPISQGWDNVKSGLSKAWNTASDSAIKFDQGMSSPKFDTFSNLVSKYKPSPAVIGSGGLDTVLMRGIVKPAAKVLDAATPAVYKIAKNVSGITKQIEDLKKVSQGTPMAAKVNGMDSSKATSGDVLNALGVVGLPKMVGNVIGGGIGVGFNAVNNAKNKQSLLKNAGQAYDEGFAFNSKLGALGQVGNEILGAMKPLIKQSPTIVKTVANVMDVPAVKKVVGFLKPEEVKDFSSWLGNTIAKAHTSGSELGLFGALQDPKEGETRLKNAWDQYKMGAAFGGITAGVSTAVPGLIKPGAKALNEAMTPPTDPAARAEWLNNQRGSIGGKAEQTTGLKIKKGVNPETLTSVQTVKDAINSGDIAGAQNLHETFSQTQKLPNFDEIVKSTEIAPPQAQLDGAQASINAEARANFGKAELDNINRVKAMMKGKAFQNGDIESLRSDPTKAKAVDLALESVQANNPQITDTQGAIDFIQNMPSAKASQVNKGMVFGDTTAKTVPEATMPQTPETALGQQPLLENSQPNLGTSPQDITTTPIGNTSSNYNIGNIKTSSPETVKAAVDEAAPSFEKIMGEGPLTHQQILDQSTLAHTELIKAVGQKTTEQLGAAQLRLRQNIAEMANSGKVTPELIEAIRTDAAFARSNAQLMGQRAIGAEPNTVVGKTMLKYIEAVSKVSDDLEGIVAKAKGVDFNDPEQAVGFYRSYIKPNVGDWLDRVRFSSMLSSPTTAIANFSSNLQGTSVVTAVEKTVTGLIDKVVSGITGKQREHFTGEGLKYLQGYHENMKTAVTSFNDAMKGTSDFGEMYNIPLTGKNTASRHAENALAYFPRLAQATDEFFNVLTTSGLEKANQYRIDKGGLAQTNEQMALEAKRRLFNQPFGTDQSHVLNLLEFLPSKIMEASHSTNPFVKWTAKFAFPFVRIPANLFKSGVEYSPLGFTTIPGANNKSEQASKAIMGTATALGSWMLASAGRLTFGMPTSEKQREAFTAAGKLPYSFDITGKGDWVQYTKLHPIVGFNMALASAVQDQMLNKSLDDGQIDTVMGVASKWLTYFANQSYVKQIGDFIDVAGGNENAVAKFMGGLPAQLIPDRALLGWVARAFDPMERKIDPNGTQLDKSLQSIMMSIPGLREHLPEQVDSQMNPVEQQHRRLNLISPARISTEKPEEAAKLNALQDQSRQTKLVKDLKAQMAKGQQFGATSGTSGGQDGQPMSLDDKKFNAIANSFNLGKISNMPEGSNLDKISKRQESFKVVEKIMDSEYPQDVKDKLLSSIGLDTSTAKYYSIARENLEYRSALVNEQLQGAKDANDVVAILKSGMKPVNGKKIVTSDVITGLYKDGVISNDLKKYLNKLEYSTTTGSVELKRGATGTGGGTKLKMPATPKIQAPKNQALKSFSTGGISTARIKKIRRPVKNISFKR